MSVTLYENLCIKVSHCNQWENLSLALVWLSTISPGFAVIKK